MKCHKIVSPLLLSAWCIVAGTACVTGADLRAVADQVDNVQRVAADQGATDKELQAAVAEAKSNIEAIADDVEKRTETTISGLSQASEGGLVGIASALALHLYRNRTRRNDLEKIKGTNG